jgi:ABC-type nitrate/sulfonate/bicarbonate transport system substrate-binding protein
MRLFKPACFRVFATVAALLLASAAPSRAAPTEIVIAASSNSFVLGGLHIAEQAHLFAPHGVVPRIVVMDSGNAAISAVISGSAQFAISGPSEAIAARARKQDMVIAANLYRGLAGSLALAKDVADKSGVATDAPLPARLHALDGLAIAFPSATSALLLPYKAAAEQLGVKIRYVYMAQPAMAAALEAGAIQGYVGSSPFWEAPVVRGKAVLWINGPVGELPQAVLPTSSSCIQMSAEVARTHPEIVKGLRAALADLAVLIRDHPDPAKAYLTKAYPTLDPAVLDLGFSKERANWTQPMFTQADMRREIDLAKASVALPGIDSVTPESLLVP